MTATHFQFRVCQNPQCGLRYPLSERSQYGERCPRCLGATVVAAEGRSEREAPMDEAQRTTDSGLSALLDNVRSTLNVGSIFRSAEGYGLAHLYLAGITPTPAQPQISKTALGAERVVPWSAHCNAVELVSALKDKGHEIWAIERTDASQAIETALRQHPMRAPRVLVVGSEQAGIDPGVLELADRVVELEMQGRKRSFNVAIAFALAAHALTSSMRDARTGYPATSVPD